MKAQPHPQGQPVGDGHRSGLHGIACLIQTFANSAQAHDQADPQDQDGSHQQPSLQPNEGHRKQQNLQHDQSSGSGGAGLLSGLMEHPLQSLPQSADRKDQNQLDQDCPQRIVEGHWAGGGVPLLTD